MKKNIALLLTLVLVCMLTACGSSNDSTTPAVTAEPAAEATAEPVVETKTEPVYDVDLTKLSSTMVYSEVYAMMSSPDTYKDKSVKMNGNFSVYHDEATDKYYFACVIADATACCSQGIEFVLSGDYKYPQDYPELGSEITVAGTFGTYYEGEYMYCQLSDAAFV